MEWKTLKVLRGTDMLNKGDLDNVTVTDGQIMLESVGGRHLLYGCYTSPELAMPEFDALVISWNSDTPPQTVIEAQARVMVDGNWLSWVKFGRWSPFIRRDSENDTALGPMQQQGEVLYLDGKTATCAQLRVYLYSKDETKSPCVWQLSCSVRPANEGDALIYNEIGNRQLRVPAYSSLLRSPLLGSSMNLPCCLAGMMNRYGEDVLPEELAMAMYDWNRHNCNNLAFAAAAAGVWGYPSYLAFLDLNHAWQLIRQGCAMVVRLNYTSDPDNSEPNCPYLENAFCEAQHHDVVITGFTEKDGDLLVLFNDPLSPTDAQCARTMPAEVLLQCWDALALVIDKKDKRRCDCKPQRTSISLRKNTQCQTENIYTLYVDGKPYPLDENFCGTPEVPTGILAVTSTDGIARATTAHKAFHFVPVIEGGIHLNKGETKVKKTVYAIREDGSMLVGDILI